MPVRVFRCLYCDFESKDEQETIEHEKTHVKQFECVKIQGKDKVPCVMNVLGKHVADDEFHEFADSNVYELTFVWKALVTNKETARQMSCIFVVSKDAMQEVFGSK